MLRPPQDTPIFKTEALRLVSNDGPLKHLLLLYKALPQSSLAITGDKFCHFDLYNTPTFKTEALRVASNKGQLKRVFAAI